jgi:hypothetical protein
MLKWRDPQLANFFGRNLQEAKLARNSSGTALYFYEKSNIHIFTTNGFVRTMKTDFREAFLDDANELVAWEKSGDYFFENGTVFPRPRPGWDDIESSIVRTKAGKYFLKDGTVTDFRAFPSHSLSVDYSGQFCLYQIADRVSAFQISQETNRFLFVQTNFFVNSYRPSIFSVNGKLYLFGEKLVPYDRHLWWLFFSSTGTNYVLEKETRLDGVSSIADMDFSSDRVLAVRGRDILKDVFYVYDLAKQKRKRIGTGSGAPLFIRRELKDKTGLK